MRGRDWFKIMRPAFAAGEMILRLLPKSVAHVFWVFVSPIPGYLGVGLRYICAKRMAKSIGANVFLGENLKFNGWESLEIGNNVSLHCGVYIDATGGILIENDVSIAHGCSLISFDHSWDDQSVPIRSNPLIYHPIHIESDVWIGCGVRILSGVTIHSRAVVAAGSVVVKSVPANSLVGGVPAKHIKNI
jgi:acetyltransferase-like isoleucine patch superfamily enzyme